MTNIYHQALAAASGNEAARLWLKARAFGQGRPTVIACDFDGTLCKSDYPDILEENGPLLAALRLMQEMGYEIILWTCREGDVLEEALDWLRNRGVAPDKVNDNSDAVIEMFDGYNSRKIFADEYWDDKAVWAAYAGEKTQ